MTAALSRIRLLVLRDARRHWARTVVLLAIVGVAAALLVAVTSIYGSVSGSVHKLTGTIAGAADIRVTGASDSGVNAQLAERIAVLPGVAVAAPVVQQQVIVHNRGVLLLGVDSSIEGLRSGLTASAVPYLDTTAFLTPNTLIAGSGTGFTKGQQLLIGDRTVTIGDVFSAPGVNSSQFLLAPLDLAQQLTTGAGRVSDIFVAVTDGTSRSQVLDEVRHVAADTAVVTDTHTDAQLQTESFALVTNATLLVAVVALVIAAFLIFNTMHMAVAQRRKDNAVLRALGASPRTLFANLLSEAVAVGIIGGAVGIGLGLLIGRFTIAALPAFATQGFTAHMQFLPPWYASVLGVVAALAICLVAALGAGWQLFSVAPVEAISAVELDRPQRSDARPAVLQLRTRPGAGLVAGAALLVASLAASGVAVWVALAVHSQLVMIAAPALMAGILGVALAATGPLVGAARWVAERCGGPGQLAAAGIARKPRRTWTNIVTVLITVAVAVGISGTLTNMAESAKQEFSIIGDNDLYVTAAVPGSIPSTLLPSGWAEIVQRTPGVKSSVPDQWMLANIGGRVVNVQGTGPNSRAVTGAVMTPQVHAQVQRGEGVLISKQLARATGLKVGSTLTLPTPTGPHTTRVLQVASLVSATSGYIGMSLDLLRQWYDRPGETMLEVTVAPGYTVDQVKKSIEDRLPDNANLWTGAEAVRGTADSVNQAGVLAVALEWLIAAVAAFGLLNTFTLAVLERRREFGVLRALGAVRRQITWTVAAEAVGIGVVGGALGLGTGVALHALGDQILAQSTASSVNFRIDVLPMTFGAAAIAICLIGALIPAVRAARLPVVDALEDR